MKKSRVPQGHRAEKDTSPGDKQGDAIHSARTRTLQRGGPASTGSPGGPRSYRSCFLSLASGGGWQGGGVGCLCLGVSVYSQAECSIRVIRQVPLRHFSRVRLFVTPWTVAYQAPLCIRFSRPEYWSGLLFPPGDLPDPGIEPISLMSSALADRL